MPNDPQPPPLHHQVNLTKSKNQNQYKDGKDNGWRRGKGGKWYKTKKSQEDQDDNRTVSW